MTASESYSPDGESVTEEDSEEIELEAIGGEVFVEPEQARVSVKELEVIDGDPVVSVSVRNDAVTLRAILEPEEAERLADELTDVAE